MKTWPPVLAVVALAIATGINLAATFWPRRFKFIEQTIPSSDKAGHFLVMGLLAAVLVWALADATWRGHRLGVLGCLAGTLLLASLEEASQLALPTRTFSWLDLAYSWAGVLVLGGLAGGFVRYRAARARVRGGRMS